MITLSLKEKTARQMCPQKQGVGVSTCVYVCECLGVCVSTCVYVCECLGVCMCVCRTRWPLDQNAQRSGIRKQEQYRGNPENVCVELAGWLLLSISPSG